MSSRGLVHIYCGDGKGKSTAALGLGLRACGQGMKVLLVRFLKDANSGELKSIAALPGFEALPTPKHLPFVPKMTQAEKTAYAATAKDMLAKAIDTVQSGEYGLLILDEACAAARHGFVSVQGVAEFLQSRPKGLEVVLTGRQPPEEWLALADYVSEIQEVKHPYRQGIPARRGIEF